MEIDTSISVGTSEFPQYHGAKSVEANENDRGNYLSCPDNKVIENVETKAIFFVAEVFGFFGVLLFKALLAYYSFFKSIVNWMVTSK